MSPASEENQNPSKRMGERRGKGDRRGVMEEERKGRQKSEKEREMENKMKKEHRKGKGGKDGMRRALKKKRKM